MSGATEDARFAEDAHELARARRLLAVMSESTQALVRAQDDRELMRDLCRIAVDRGGYRMAWIGLKEHGPRRPIRPVAASGVDAGYTDSLQVSWDEDDPHGRGPSGRAVRTGEPFVARFISTDPVFALWRDEALARGYASSIALPFRVDGAVAGVLHIYSGEPDAFDAQETRLLCELALDLGNGVQALRAREQSQRSAARLAHVNQRLERLARAVQALSGARDLDAIVEVVRTAARHLVGADGATCVVREGDECVYVGEDAIEPLWRGRRFPTSECISGLVMEQRARVVIEDVQRDPRVAAALYEPTFVRGMAMVPIHRVDPVGAIGVYWSTPRRASDDELGLLETLADSVAIAMERVRALGALAESEARYRTLVESLEDVVFSVEPDGRIQYLSPSIAKYGYAPSDLVGRHYAVLVHDEDRASIEARVVRALAGSVEAATFRALDRSGGVHFVRATGRALVRDGRVVAITGVMVDLSELRRTEEQLWAAQKMEAVGRLAGGVAHDFNNLLSVILAYAGFVGEAVAEHPQLRADTAEIVMAATRATALTRQLLAFSRRQVLEPQVLDLNRLTSDLEKMLRRLIGEDVELVKRLAPDLGRVKADPGQIEQVVVNLVVNARDAMPDGGTITIETTNAELGPAECATHPALQPGSFVRLSVRDTGLGMDETTKQRLFEPFYTTKEIGRGTGLGLSTVYGIVQQSGGCICFSSERGAGTTFDVFLPRFAGVEPTHTRAGVAASLPRGCETVLVVEDDHTVRAIAERVLSSAGYRVLTAADGPQALATYAVHRGEIDLLLTDVVMPHMFGSELAERVRQDDPRIRVLFFSGYTDNIVARHGVLEPGAELLGKPFSARELAEKVRAVLDAGR